ncbi:Acetyltransferase (GNAT)-family protein [Candidatus Protochlamydia naegleriophila]|uniref:Acetyltransferase (GNAT)-family protein n=1 Tax=Candidatus Protochlamydia naegleriophila TaxID=389348 RepID=A0A0U5JHA8_9BACT|nr:GNAT family protein [Candidatus Protochlamydia naegleriophila]CUI17349.1 Acetyltransferase (GNAT)-family protein [Candidatus Protochlamydia naegleriophila]
MIHLKSFSEQHSLMNENVIPFKISPFFELAIDTVYSIKLPRIEWAGSLFQLVDHNRAYLSEYLPWVDHTLSAKDSEHFIKHSLEQAEKGKSLHLCIWEKECLVGLIGLHYIDRLDRKTEIGYWISEEHQGKGIITKCCQRLIKFCFQDLQLHRVEIRCQASNLRSQSIPKQLGFKHEGTLRGAFFRNGQFSDCLIFGLLATDQLVNVKY